MNAPRTDETMRAWAIEAYGGPEQLKLMELPRPRLRGGDVLIRMRGAEVGDWDALVRSGEWPMERPFPLVLGLAGAGTVAALGGGVSGFAKGDLVYVYSYPLYDNGAWAEYMLVPASAASHAPRSLEPSRAGALPIAGLTAHETLNDLLNVASGDSLLVTAAAGGVGHLAVQIGASLRAQVIGTASTANVESVRSLGARWVVDYRSQDVETEVRKLFPHGVDCVLSGVSGDAANRAARTLRRGGRMVDLPGAVTEVPDGVTVISDYVVKADSLRLELLAAMVDAGTLRLEVQKAFAFEHAPKALELVLGHHVRGKVSIVMS
jgi:NADPH:quinone reductase-like Zn-dependent oxidoreductase